MGLKWQYELAFPGMTDSLEDSKSEKSGQPAVLLSKHWDAEAFHTFRSASEGFAEHHPGFVLRSSHKKTVYGVKLDTISVIPTWEDRIQEQLVPILIRALEGAVLTAIATGSATLVITLPAWVPAAVLVLILSEVARRSIWSKHPESEVKNLRFICPTQEIFDAVDRHFQGTWELP